MRVLNPSIQTFVFKTSRAMAYGGPDENSGNPFHLIAVCSFYLNGYGVTVNVEEGLRSIARASRFSSNNEYANAYVYRFHHAYGVPVDSDLSIESLLIVSALKGSRMALKDLSIVSPDRITTIKAQIRNIFAGTGADFYVTTNMLHGLDHTWLRGEANFDRVLNDTRTLHDFAINRHGDRLIHFAASCGMIDAVSKLLNAGFDINQVNPLGETALLCACRSGQADMARLLLRNDASAAITALNGETPLHWIVSFEDGEVDEIGQALIQNGANHQAVTKTRICYSVFPGTIDVDHQLPGTPLRWAVHYDRAVVVRFLLRIGAEPLEYPNGIYPDPLQWAAFMHHHECLRLMIESLEARKVNFTYGKLLQGAINGADEFSMIIRNGTEYKEKLHATLDLLDLKTKNIQFVTGIGGIGQTLLYFAVSEAHDLVVEYFLQKPARLQEINIARPVDGRTPLLESVRWNRMSVFYKLVTHGADVHALEQNPFTKEANWTALHVLAFAGHNNDVGIMEKLIAMGVPADGRPPGSVQVETPMLVAIQNDSFTLANVLRTLGADANALSLSSSFTTAPYPMTLLGHVIISNSRNSSCRIQYITEICQEAGQDPFIVEPERRLSALQRAAWGHRELSSFTGKELGSEDFDMQLNRDIFHELLEIFDTPEHRNMKSLVLGRTALHFAVDAQNWRVVHELIDVGADTEIVDDAGETPLGMARRLIQVAGQAVPELERCYNEFLQV